MATAAAVLLGLLGLVSLWGYVYWKYHADWLAERRAIAALNAYDVLNPPGATEGPVTPMRFEPKLVQAYVLCADWSPWYWLDEWLDRLCWPVSQFRIQVKQVTVVAGADLTDASLADLAAFKHIQAIVLNAGAGVEGYGLTKITDAGLASLGTLSELTILDLCGENFTDSGLVHLYGLKNLSELNVAGTKVTEEGIRQLKQVLPGVKVEGP